MIGLPMLSWIDRRCREIYPSRASEDFGGLNIILVGDFYQLPPVADRPLYSTNIGRAPDQVNGQRLYKRFDQTIILDVVMRQQGADQQSIAFRGALGRLRVNQANVEDWKLLATRVQANITTSGGDVTLFDTAVRLYAKRAAVQAFNLARLCDSGNPVLIIRACHTGPQAEKVDTDEAGNLAAFLPLSINSRIMLTENIWTERGLVNGALGIVRDIVWPAGTEDPRQEPPLALLVSFDLYDTEGHGAYIEDSGGERLVPVFRSRREWTRSGALCSRTQFPVTLAYAITIHKSQGLSLDCAVLDLSDKDFAPGLTYVAISRVRSLEGLLFEGSFDYRRLRFAQNDTLMMRAADTILRAQQQIALPVCIMYTFLSIVIW